MLRFATCQCDAPSLLLANNGSQLLRMICTPVTQTLAGEHVIRSLLLCSFQPEMFRDTCFQLQQPGESSRVRGTCLLGRAEGKFRPIQDQAHTDYIRYIAVHPTLPYLLSCSDDMSIKSGAKCPSDVRALSLGFIPKALGLGQELAEPSGLYCPNLAPSLPELP